MNVCMVAYAFYEKDNRIRRYAEALAARGDRVDVVALRQPGQSLEGELKGVRIFRIQERVRNEVFPTTYLYRLLLFLLQSAAFLARRSFGIGKYDVIHVHSVPDFEVFSALVPKLLGAKVILDIHDIVPEFYMSKFHKSHDSLAFRLLVLVERLSIAFSNHLIIANHIWHDRLISRSVKSEKCTTILNYPDLEIFRKGIGSQKDEKFRMTYPGSLNWHQGVDVAIRAFSKIARKYPHAVFHIYGEGPERKALEKLVTELGMEGCVQIRDSIPLEGIARIMGESDAGIVPKRAASFGDEAFSTKILEFMAMEVPVIASSTRIDRYYFDDSQILFFRSEDEDDLAEKMEALILDGDLRKRLVRNASEYIRVNNWDIKRQEYFSLLDAL